MGFAVPRFSSRFNDGPPATVTVAVEEIVAAAAAAAAKVQQSRLYADGMDLDMPTLLAETVILEI